MTGKRCKIQITHRIYMWLLRSVLQRTSNKHPKQQEENIKFSKPVRVVSIWYPPRLSDIQVEAHSIHFLIENSAKVVCNTLVELLTISILNVTVFSTNKQSYNRVTNQLCVTWTLDAGKCSPYRKRRMRKQNCLASSYLTHSSPLTGVCATPNISHSSGNYT